MIFVQVRRIMLGLSVCYFVGLLYAAPVVTSSASIPEIPLDTLFALEASQPVIKVVIQDSQTAKNNQSSLNKKIAQQAIQNAKSALSLMSMHDKPLQDALRTEWLFNYGIEEISAAVQPFGYFRATIEPVIQKKDNQLILMYKVVLNDRILLRQVNIQLVGAGEKDYYLKRAIERSGLKAGEPLSQLDYDQLKARLSTIAAERGFFVATFSDEKILVDLETYSADIHLVFVTDERYRFSGVNFNNIPLRSDFLQRYVRFTNQTPYSDYALTTLQTDLINSGYFSNVTLQPEVDEATQTVPIQADLAMRPQHQYLAGLGYGSDQGARVRLGREWRYVNSRGHQAMIDVLVAQRRQNILLNYTIPGQQPMYQRWKLYAGMEAEDQRYKDYKTYLMGVSYWQTRHPWSIQYGIEYRRDDFKLPNAERYETQLLVPSVSWQWNSRRNVRFTQWAMSAELTLRGASEWLLSDISFIQAQFRSRAFLPLNDRHRFIIRGDFGSTYVRPSSDFQRLPLALRFYSGGDNTVRGYALNQLGPRQQGEVVGGKQLLNLSLEYEYKWRENWGLATFVDAGNAFDNVDWDPRLGVGLGARWYSPVGAVRLDLARGLDQSLADPFRLHLTIGFDL